MGDEKKIDNQKETTRFTIEDLEKIRISDPLLERKIKAFRARMIQAHRRGDEKLATLKKGSAERKLWKEKIKRRRNQRKVHYRNLLEKALRTYNSVADSTRISACPRCFSTNLQLEQLLISDSIYYCRDCSYSGRWVVEQSVAEFSSLKEAEDE